MTYPHKSAAECFAAECGTCAPEPDVLRRPYEELHAEIDELALELSQERLLAQELHAENQRLRDALAALWEWRRPVALRVPEDLARDVLAILSDTENR